MMAGGTLLSYEVHAQVGGKIAQLGARLIDASAKQMADAFFDRFSAQVAPPGGEVAVSEVKAPPPLRAHSAIGVMALVPREPFGLPVVAWLEQGRFIWRSGFLDPRKPAVVAPDRPVDALDALAGRRRTADLPIVGCRDGDGACRAWLHRRPGAGDDGPSGFGDAAAAVPGGRAWHRQDRDRQGAGCRAESPPWCGCNAMMGWTLARLRLMSGTIQAAAHGDPAWRRRLGTAIADELARRHLYAGVLAGLGRCCRRSTLTCLPPAVLLIDELDRRATKPFEAFLLERCWRISRSRCRSWGLCGRGRRRVVVLDVQPHAGGA